MNIPFSKHCCAVCHNWDGWNDYYSYDDYVAVDDDKLLGTCTVKGGAVGQKCLATDGEKCKLYDKIYSELELDELARPKKTNKRKRNIPLYVYLILEEKSDPQHHLKQTEIAEILEKEYEVSIQRQALGRTIHALSNENLGVCCSPTDGVWLNLKSA